MLIEAIANSSFGTFIVLACAVIAVSEATVRRASKVLVMVRVFTLRLVRGKWYRAVLPRLHRAD
jgi:hypothetical protein